MLGKANSLKSKVVYAQYENWDKPSERRWVDLGESLSKALSDLGASEVVQISFHSIPYGEGELHEAALILFRE